MTSDLTGRARGTRDLPVRAAVIQVKVKPRSRFSRLTPGEGGVWLAELKSPPVDGKANEELVALIARHFGRPKSAVSVKSGASGRTKLVQIEGGARSGPGSA